jgi:hypothetical protein
LNFSIRLSEQFSESQAAFGTTFRVTGGFRKADQDPARGLLEGFSQLLSYFMGACKNFINFIKKQPKIVKKNPD